jgi:hypothetical protein
MKNLQTFEEFLNEAKILSPKMIKDFDLNKNSVNDLKVLNQLNNESQSYEQSSSPQSTRRSNRLINKMTIDYSETSTGLLFICLI